MTSGHVEDVRRPSRPSSPLVFTLLGSISRLAPALLFKEDTMTTSAASRRILVVDDEPEIRSFMGDALAVFGYDVAAAGDAEEAFKLVAHTRFDLVMSDLRLPGLRGWDFVAKLRSIDRAVPLVMLTGSAPDDEDLRRVREAGIAVLHKPVQLPQLQTALTKAMERAA
jgi:CheY-like chemotaxis protein